MTRPEQSESIDTSTSSGEIADPLEDQIRGLEALQAAALEVASKLNPRHLRGNVAFELDLPESSSTATEEEVRRLLNVGRQAADIAIQSVRLQQVRANELQPTGHTRSPLVENQIH